MGEIYTIGNFWNDHDTWPHGSLAPRSDSIGEEGGRDGITQFLENGFFFYYLLLRFHHLLPPMKFSKQSNAIMERSELSQLKQTIQSTNNLDSFRIYQCARLGTYMRKKTITFPATFRSSRFSTGDRDNGQQRI